MTRTASTFVFESGMILAILAASLGYVAGAVAFETAVVTLLAVLAWIAIVRYQEPRNDDDDLMTDGGIEMSDVERCMRCGSLVEYNGRSYDCEGCNTRWIPHNLSVSKEVQEMSQPMMRESQEARERREAWQSLSLFTKAKIKLGFNQFDRYHDTDEEDSEA